MVWDLSERVRVRSLNSSQAHWTLPPVFPTVSGMACLRRGETWLRVNLDLVLFSLSVGASSTVSEFWKSAIGV